MVVVANPGDVDHVLLVPAHHHDVLHPAGAQGVDLALQDRAALDVEHALGPILGQRQQRLAGARRDDHRAGGAGAGREVGVLDGLELVDAHVLVDLLERHDVGIQRVEAPLAGQRLQGLLHALDRAAQHLVGPDHHLDPGALQLREGDRGVEGGHHHHRRRAVPETHELQDLGRGLGLGVHEHHVRPRVGVGVGPAQRLLHAPARDEGLDPRDQHEVGVLAGVDRGADLARELLHRQELALHARVEAALLGEDVVLHADARDARPLVLLHGAHDVDHVAVAVVDVRDDRRRHRLVDEQGGLEVLGHGEQVHVRHRPLGGGDREAGGPHHREARRLDELGGERVVGAHHRDQARPAKERAQESALGHHFPFFWPLSSASSSSCLVRSLETSSL